MQCAAVAESVASDLFPDGPDCDRGPLGECSACPWPVDGLARLLEPFHGAPYDLLGHRVHADESPDLAIGIDAVMELDEDIAVLAAGLRGSFTETFIYQKLGW